ncbi:hypothetical protein [Nocardia neocaledoniensis]|uniref:hypothetical protein n=1 Tax=Nocardia neocaledoniensis TaxID=236511 RepID=UPI002458D167|nr:hypothetical protein [Nocardia neocaledoniensis]
MNRAAHTIADDRAIDQNGWSATRLPNSRPKVLARSILAAGGGGGGGGGPAAAPARAGPAAAPPRAGGGGGGPRRPRTGRWSS